MSEINWTPERLGTVPRDVIRNPERAKAEAMFDREKIGYLPISMAIDILIERLERLERKSDWPSSTIDKREEWQLKRK